jgi:DNA polymerase lambda
VGPTTAESFYNQGFRSLHDLEAKAALNRQQAVGLRLLDDLDKRMSREEAGEIEAFVRKHASCLRQGLEIIACGSYRREKATCGDLDVLITHKKDEVLTGLLDQVVRDLEGKSFLTDHLTMQRDGNQHKYTGVCKLPGDNRYLRRLDIIVIPYMEKATALLYLCDC